MACAGCDADIESVCGMWIRTENGNKNEQSGRTGNTEEAGNAGSTLDPEPEGVKGFNEFMDRYLTGLPIERAAVESKIW